MQRRFSVLQDTSQSHGDSRQHRQKAEIVCAEFQQIPLSLCAVVLGKFAISDERCQRRDQRADTADIDSHQQFAIVVRELRQQDRRRHIADHLTRSNAKLQRALLHQP